ncbi:MAG: hypothetical protein HQ553_06790 [Chloroflexi bacterium]|nr:hypothetical protein [Chloroflexota bacterium]
MTDPLFPADDGTLEVEKDLTRLTCIREAYTLASTPEPGRETDMLMINNFLTTLADVAFAVASRNLRDKQEGEDQ